jgi:hypothetical protein
VKPELAGLPGAGRVAAGLRELAAGQATANALLVSIARERLAELGIEVPREAVAAEPELALYAALGATEGDAYYRYNALVRELDSFLAALAARAARAPRRRP